MNWNWEPAGWKKSTRLLLGLVTAWPPIYMALFFVSIFSILIFAGFAATQATRSCGDIDLLQLDEKIRNGQIKELTAKPRTIIAKDLASNCDYEVSVSNEDSRKRILDLARENVNGHPRVERIQEESQETSVSPAFPIGFMFLFGAHFLTIMLLMALMPLYIVLAV